MTMRLPDHDIYMKDYLVSHLLSPHFIKDEGELQKFCREAGFVTDTDRFVLIVVRIERWSDVFQETKESLEASRHHFFLLNNMLQEQLNRSNMAVVAEKDYEMVAIVNLRQDWETFRREVRALLEQTMEVLETEFNISITISVSEMVQGFADLPEASRQAEEALWYNEFLGGDRQILFYEQLCDEYLPMIRSELTELDKKLINKLQMGDAAGVKYVIHEMIDRELIQTVPSVKILRTRLGGICCKILDAMEELTSSMEPEFYISLNPAPQIVEAKTLGELTGNMDDLFDSICRKVNVATQEPKPQWVDRMNSYIEEHYTDENLGLTEVSAAFGITPSYATRVFKQYTGRGIYETIQHVRLAAAKSLMGTDMTMKQIAQRVGYTSFLSMNRAFKKYEGTTPSQFRDQ